MQKLYPVIIGILIAVTGWQWFTGSKYKSDAELYRVRADTARANLAEEQRKGKDNLKLLEKQISDLRRTSNQLGAKSNELGNLIYEDQRILEVLSRKLKAGNSGKGQGNKQS